MASRKVRVDALGGLERYVAELPPCQPQEVTTREAVRMVLPQIQAMQTKGYSLDAVAQILSENGIEVTALALKRYLQLADAGRTRGARKPTRPNRAACEPSGVPADSGRRNLIENGAITATAEAVATTREGASSRTSGTVPANKEVVAISTASRRSTSVIRKGSDDA